MNYETMKTFILYVLVGISFLLSFILWSYQPNYDLFYDTSYVNEVDVGGQEKTKNELVEPVKIAFKKGDSVETFIDPEKRRSLYKDMASWVMSDYTVTEADGRPQDKNFVELIFPTEIPADLLTNLFTFNEEIDIPNWEFERVFMLPKDDSKSVKVVVLSKNQDRQLVARIDKSEVYQMLRSYIVDDNELLHENIVLDEGIDPIYIPKGKVQMAKKTVIATDIDAESFINALFRNPSIVTSNPGEAYFTDGQRGMRIAQSGRRLEFINPLQSNYERLSPMELLEKSVNNINEHKGWTNNFMFDYTSPVSNNIRYRLTYDGYPVFDYNHLSVMEQEWREQELYQYNRPLIKAGNLLNSEDQELASGEQIKELLEADKRRFNLDNMTDIRTGYLLNYVEDTHSLTLEPHWFILYENDWVKFDINDYIFDYQKRGED